MSLSVLHVGGTGTISLSCVERSLTEGHRVAVLNRGGLPAGAFSCKASLEKIHADPIRHRLADPAPPDARIDAIVGAAIDPWG